MNLRYLKKKKLTTRHQIHRPPLPHRDILLHIFEQRIRPLQRHRLKHPPHLAPIRIPTLVQFELQPQHDIQRGRIVTVTPRIPILRSFIELATLRLRPNRYDAVLRQRALHPRQHDLAMHRRGVDDQQYVGGDHLNE